MTTILIPTPSPSRTEEPTVVQLEPTEMQRQLSWMLDEVRAGRWVRGTTLRNNQRCAIGMVRKVLGWPGA